MSVASRLVVITCALALAGTVVRAQAPAPAPERPPVLSTAPTPPPGAPMDPSQMSGFPLQVGDLPPGIVAVRVVRRSFAENVSGQLVELHVGTTGAVLKATTGTDGRAKFDGLKIGETVHARTEVDAETLESQRFQLPAQGGVRLVLVAGIGAGVPAGSAPPSPAPVNVTVPETTSGLGQRTKIAGPLALALVGLGTGWFWRFRRARRLETSGPETARLETFRLDAAIDADRTGGEDLLGQRASAFDRLVKLEHDRKAGRVEGASYAERREQLMGEIVAFDARLNAPIH